MEQRIEGRRVVFEDRGGRGPDAPVVLLHPFPLDQRCWDDVGARLASGRRVIAPGVRGFGESDLGGGFSIADLADDVVALLDGLGCERAIVAGVSMGGYVALALAARHAARLAGLVLVDTKAAADSPEARAARGEAIKLVGEKGVAAYVEAQLARLVGPRASAEARDLVRQIAADQPAASVIAGLEALRDRPDRRGELAAITCPTLVVVGAEDGITPPAEARSMADAIAGARLVEIPGAGHLAPLEAPEEVYAAMRAFVGEV